MITVEDMPRAALKDLGGAFDSRKHLANAARQARERHYDQMLIVDVDSHHYESDSWSEVFSYIEDPVIRQRFQASASRRGRTAVTPVPIGDQDVAGRIVRSVRRTEEVEAVEEGTLHKDVTINRRYMDSLGVDYAIVFPTPMLHLGLHPDHAVEVALARAYARWFSERVLSVDSGVKTMLYLPFNNPAASLRMVEEFSDLPGVVGFMVTATRYRGVHDNAYVPLYAALQERDMPLGFHAVYNWQERSAEQFNRFLSAHSLGFTYYNMVHMTNWVINGLPERFPQLKVIWIESGVAWLPFLMDRLDHEYVMRSSEAPLLTKLPSEYIADMYYTSQPLERTNLNALEYTLKRIKAKAKLMYSSDYPHWDFDLPSSIYDLPFLDEKAKRQILGETAREVFKLDER